MVPIGRWQLIYVLGNLQLPEYRPPLSDGSYRNFPTEGLTLGCRGIAVVPPNDPRVTAIATREPSAARLLQSFRDLTGQPYHPAVLIAESKLLRRINRDESAIVAFRNALALSIILKERAKAIKNGSSVGPTWSDFFDAFPITIGRRGRLLTLSPAVQGVWLDDTKPISAPAPYLPHFEQIPSWDHYLWDSLGKLWTKFYSYPRPNDHLGHRVFRSLELAYQACATPIKNQGSLHDYGVMVALWVSALEVLAHPGKGNVTPEHVINLIGSYQWSGRMLNGPWYDVFVNKGEYIKGKFVQAAYRHLYDFRSKFLHGDRVTERLIRPFPRRRWISVIDVAPFLYRTALVETLRQEFPLPTETNGISAAIGYELFDHEDYETALERIIRNAGLDQV